MKERLCLLSPFAFHAMFIVDVFYMKTCRFRNAHPRRFGEHDKEEPEEGILCEKEPTAQYDMLPCREKHCWLCQRRFGESGEVLPWSVDFSPQQSHRFVNKYETFLNCPAVSDTYHNDCM